MQNKSFSGIHLQHEIRGVKGNDIISEGQLGKFQRIGESLGNFKLLDNYSELGREFEDIAKNLIDQWRILNLYVPNSFSGRVAWTYPGERTKYVPKPTPKTGRKAFVGFNITLGMPMTMPYYYDYTPYYSEYYEYEKGYLGIGGCPKLGLDISWPLSDKFAIGFYINGGPNFTLNRFTGCWYDQYYDEYNPYYYSRLDIGFDVKVGILMLVGDVTNRPFIIGASPCTGFNLTNEWANLPLELRFGRVLGERFYITGNLNLGIPLGGPLMIEPGIALGWRLGKLQ